MTIFQDARKKGRRYFFVFYAALVFISFAFIAYGLYRGESGILLKKAIRICMECIGLG
ncbi:MAG: hypothetical protein IJU95_09090 [Treponema sp.]|nr:hypothetical protein [Treponema sp.]